VEIETDRRLLRRLSMEDLDDLLARERRGRGSPNRR
jgi:hypothetical protein